MTRKHSCLQDRREAQTYLTAPGAIVRRGLSSIPRAPFTLESVHRIVIIGGGFGGVTAARHLAGQADASVTLVADEPWLEYYGVLYRLIRGGPISQACIPLAMVLPASVTVVIDRAKSADAHAKTVQTEAGKTLSYDTLILAPGAEPAYFGIPGMQEHSLSMSNVHEALRIHGYVLEHPGRFVVIGGGATGVEVSGELIGYLPTVQVELIEAMDRLLPQTEPATSARVLKRLRALGVNVRLNTAVASVEQGMVHLKDGSTIDASAIVWTAGVKASGMLATVAGLELDKKGRAIVDEHLHAKGVSDVYVLGDSAATPFSGMAQTAYADGRFVARVIAARRSGTTLPSYNPSAPAYAIPAGRGWAATKFGVIRAFGFFGYVLRRAADIHVYMLLLRWRFVRAAFFGTIPLEKYGISVRPAS